MTFFIGTPHTRRAGYFFNRYSADSKVEEADVQTCSHCQAVIKMSEWKQDGGWCSKCQAPLCNHAECIAETARLGCVPFTKKIEVHMERATRLDQHIRTLGLESPVAPQQIVLP